jgi:hypothetical protein
MNRHAVLTHAPIPYFSNAAAGSDSERHLQGIVRAIKNGENRTLSKTGQQVLATKLLVDGLTMADADRLFFGTDRTMAPVPSSAILGQRPRESWPC